MRSFRLLAVALVASLAFGSFSEAGCFGAAKARRQARRMARLEARQAACAAPGAAFVRVTEYRSYYSAQGVSCGVPAGFPAYGATGSCQSR